MPRIYPFDSPSMDTVMSTAPELAIMVKYCRSLCISCKLICISNYWWLRGLLPKAAQSLEYFKPFVYSLTYFVVLMLSLATLVWKDLSTVAAYLYGLAQLIAIAQALDFEDWHSEIDYFMVPSHSMMSCLLLAKALLFVHHGIHTLILFCLLVHSVLSLGHHLIYQLAPKTQLSAVVKPLYEYLKMPLKVLEGMADVQVVLLFLSTGATSLAAIYSILLVLGLEFSSTNREAAIILANTVEHIVYNISGDDHEWHTLKLKYVGHSNPKKERSPTKHILAAKRTRKQSTRLASFSLNTIEVINDLK